MEIIETGNETETELAAVAATTSKYLPVKGFKLITSNSLIQARLLTKTINFLSSPHPQFLLQTNTRSNK